MSGLPPLKLLFSEREGAQKIIYFSVKLGLNDKMDLPSPFSAKKKSRATLDFRAALVAMEEIYLE